jgi:CRISPR/Cas system-associated protein Cas5 (RAMP superfamily)
MIEKIVSYKTADGIVFPKKGTKEITTYKTEDSRVFFKEEAAEKHTVKLKDEKDLIKTSEKIRQLFEQEMLVFIRNTDDYKGVSIKDKDTDLDYDFWDAKTMDTLHKISVDVDIDDFEEYVLLIKALLEDYHLQEVINIVKEMTYKETT